jgi:esterase/lipase
LLVAVGAKDQLIRVESGITMAQEYGVKPHQYAEMAHMLQMEQGWEAVAFDVLQFLEEHY